MAVPFLQTTPYTAYDSSRIRDGGEEQIDNLLTWNEVSEKRPKSHFLFLAHFIHGKSWVLFLPMYCTYIKALVVQLKKMINGTCTSYRILQNFFKIMRPKGYR